MRRQVRGCNEDEQRVNVHRELKWGKVRAREEGEEAIERGNLVQEQGERGEGGAGA